MDLALNNLQRLICHKTNKKKQKKKTNKKNKQKKTNLNSKFLLFNQLIYFVSFQTA